MMETTAASSGTNGGPVGTVSLLVGVGTLGALVPSAIMMVAVALGMIVVFGFRLDETLGVPVYMIALAGGAAAYGAVIHAVVVHARERATVPWAVWPALAAAPVIWALVSTLGDPRGVLEPIPSVLAIAGMVGALITLTIGRRLAR